MNVIARAFQLAWPPLAYSIADDDEARRAYSLVFTWFAAVCAFGVAGLWLLAPLDRRPARGARVLRAYKAVGLLATGSRSTRFTSVLVVILGRTGRTEFNSRRDRGHGRQRRREPGADPAAGDRGRGDRAGRVVRRRPGAHVRAHAAPLPGAVRVGPAGAPARRHGATVAGGELLLPTSGFGGFASRLVLWLALPAVLLAAGFLTHEERAGLRSMLARPRSASACERWRASPPRARRAGVGGRLLGRGLRGRAARRGPALGLSAGLAAHERAQALVLLAAGRAALEVRAHARGSRRRRPRRRARGRRTRRAGRSTARR